MQFETAPNPGAMTGGGAGIQAAQLASEKGSEVVITGHVGPNAFQILSASGIRIFIGAEGTVKNAIEEFQRGNLREVNRATTAAHTGMGRGGGRGGGQGYGRRRQT